MTSFDPPPPILNFVGRRRELESLHARANRREAPSVIAVLGPGGIGKTALVTEFLGERSRRRTFWLKAYEQRIDDEKIDSLLDELRNLKDRGQAIVVLDGAEHIDSLEHHAARILNYKRVQSIIVTSRATAFRLLRSEALFLAGLQVDESVELLSRIVPRKLEERQLHTLAIEVNGHPLTLVLLAQLLKNRTVEQVLMQLRGDWDDVPLPTGIAEKQVIEVVAPKIIIANDSLIQKLKRTPEDLHKVSPRKFEELIGDLLTDMGWEIELTPESKDGGKDIIAVLKTELGRFLCLVEAKHYNPKRPVQVGLVRQLYGTFVDHGANSAMLVTSSRFTRGARDFQSKHEYQITLKEYGDVVGWIQKYKNQKPLE